MSREHAYAYEAGYRDGSIHYELEHCPACKNVADLQEALAENAELREDLEFERSENGWAREFLNRMGQKCGTKDCLSLVAYVTKLEADNAKLRELVVTLMACASVDDCDKCPINGAEFKVSEVRCCYAAKQRMRELGIEVDE